MVPLSRVRALSAELAACFVNKRSEGFWNHAPAEMGGGQYRIINNTAGCIGPWLAVFREQPPQLAWSAHSRSSPQLVHHGGTLWPLLPSPTIPLTLPRPAHSAPASAPPL